MDMPRATLPLPSLLLALLLFLLVAAPQRGFAQCTGDIPRVADMNGRFTICPGSGGVTKMEGTVEVARIRAGSGSLHITSLPGQSVFINGVDVLREQQRQASELAELRSLVNLTRVDLLAKLGAVTALCGACGGTTTAAPATPTVPKVITPNIQLKIKAWDAHPIGKFGSSVAVKETVMVVGALGANGNASEQGAVYVFSVVGSVWVPQQKLVASDGAQDDWFGVSMDFDGTTILVGASRTDNSGERSGSVYVFTRSGSTWTQQQKLVASDAAGGDEFGTSVALDGNNLIVGADGDEKGGSNGSAYVFTLSNGIWVQRQKLTALDAAAGAHFGFSVAICGNTAVIGSYLATDSGAVYVFTDSGTSWGQQQKIVSSDGAAGDDFGWAVAFDGATIVVGAINGNVTNSGLVDVFTRPNGTWTKQQRLIASDAAASDNFGFSVAISHNTIIVGAYRGEGTGRHDSGSAYVFTRTGTTWLQQAELTALDGAAGDRFGNAVAIDGASIVVGSCRDGDGGDGGQTSGSVYVF